jgi:putative transposase
VGKWLISRLWSGENPRLMITLLLHLLRLFPFLCGGYRQLALENLALRHQLAAHHRRRVLHFNVTEHPSAAWTAQQLVDAFPDDSAPAYLLRDRDRVYGHAFRHRAKGMGIREVLTAPQSPWQNPFVERLIGSIRRECLDHVLVLSERHLRRILTRYFVYYHRARTHLALDKDAPDRRPIEPPELSRIIQIPEVGGLHHRYVRRAA